MANIACMQEDNVIVTNEVEDRVDYFDHVPDAIVSVIFNKIMDAKSLCRCLAVSKRFAALVPEVENVCVRMNHPKLKQPIEEGSKSRNGSRSVFKNFVSKFITKPFNFLQHMMLNGKKVNSSSCTSSGVDVFNWVNTALKNFDQVHSIKLELPCYGGEIGIGKSTPLLKWEAGFGREMERCVILGATSVEVAPRNKKLSSGDGNNNDEHVFTDEELKLRIIWIISCLIASSGRHNLMKKMVGQCPKLKSAVISDAGKQGKLQMNATQIKELRDSIDSTTDTNKNGLVSESEAPAGSGGVGPVTPTTAVSAQMGCVGNLVMKLWYIKELELPNSGQVMKGATLVVIMPENKVNGSDEKGKEGNLYGSFEGEEVFEEAAKELLSRKEKRVYRLEMNSF